MNLRGISQNSQFDRPPPPLQLGTKEYERQKSQFSMHRSNFHFNLTPFKDGYLFLTGFLIPFLCAFLPKIETKLSRTSNYNTVILSIHHLMCLISRTTKSSSACSHICKNYSILKVTRNLLT